MEWHLSTGYTARTVGDSIYQVRSTARWADEARPDLVLTE